MSKKIKFGALAGLVIVLLVVVAINNRNSTSDSIKIGVISSLSGLVVGGDNLGQGFVNGLILAHEEYLRNNPDKKVEVYIEDDGYDSKKGVSAYQKLTSINNIDGLINLSSPTIDAVVENVKAQNLPVIQLGAESKVVEDSIYQIYPDQTSIGILGDIADQDGVRNLVVATVQIKAYDKFISDFDEKYDGEMNVQKISSDENNLASLALKIKEINPEGLVIFMDSKKGAQLLKKLQENGYTPKNIYIDQNLQWGLSDYKEILGNLNMLEGSKSLYSTSKMTNEFQTKYKERFKVDVVPSMAGLGYDSFITMIENYSDNTNKWKNNMNKYFANGVTGEVSFSPIGLRPPQFSIAEFKNGELIVK